MSAVWDVKTELNLTEPCEHFKTGSCQLYLSLPRQEHQSLLEKLSVLEKKVIVGGVDLLAKAEEQEKLLEESNMELEERRRRAEQLRKELEEKEVGCIPSYLEVVGHTITCLCLFMWIKYDSTLKLSRNQTFQRHV